MLSKQDFFIFCRHSSPLLQCIKDKGELSVTTRYICSDDQHLVVTVCFVPKLIRLTIRHQQPAQRQSPCRLFKNTKVGNSKYQCLVLEIPTVGTRNTKEWYFKIPTIGTQYTKGWYSNGTCSILFLQPVIKTIFP